MNIVVKVIGAGSLTADLLGRAAMVTARAAVAVTETADDIVRDAKAAAPAVTGTLRDSISRGDLTVTPTSVSTDVGPAVFYGRFVEDGTARTSPRPYMRPATDGNIDAFAEKVGKAIGS